jgi:type II secretory pathway pseudopilin PulG
MTPRRAPSFSARALTLVEVLLSVALLSLAIGVVMNAVGSILTSESRGRERLAAYEVANRLILQYLDNARSMPRSDLPIEYGDYRFYWDMSETPANMVINSRQESSGANLMALNRYGLLCVEVCRVERVGDTETRGEPLALISRAMDPAATRNPDSLEAVGIDGVIQTIQRITSGDRGSLATRHVGGGRQLK